MRHDSKDKQRIGRHGPYSMYKQRIGRHGPDSKDKQRGGRQEIGAKHIYLESNNISINNQQPSYKPYGFMSKQTTNI